MENVQLEQTTELHVFNFPETIVYEFLRLLEIQVPVYPPTNRIP